MKKSKSIAQFWSMTGLDAQYVEFTWIQELQGAWLLEHCCCNWCNWCMHAIYFWYAFAWLKLPSVACMHWLIDACTLLFKDSTIIASNVKFKLIINQFQISDELMPDLTFYRRRHSNNDTKALTKQLRLSRK